MATTPNQATASDPPDNHASPISEADLARTLGVSREDLKKFRADLTHGTHWTGGNGTQVMITVDGQKMLAAMVADKSAEAGTPGPIQRAVEACRRADRYTSLTITRIANPRTLLAKKDGTEETVRLITRPSPHFRPGMVLERCEASRTPGVFYYHGRLPRRPGKI